MNLSSGDAPMPVAKPAASKTESKAANMVNELKKELSSVSTNAVGDINSMLNRVLKLEKENEEIKNQLKQALARLDQLEVGDSPAPVAAKAESEEEDDDSDDDDMDFFG